MSYCSPVDWRAWVSRAKHLVERTLALPPLSDAPPKLEGSAVSWPGSQRQILWGAVATLVLIGVWAFLVLRQFNTGPTAWDDTMYAQNAAFAIYDPDVFSRYAHIWPLRICYLLVDDRIQGAALLSVGVLSCCMTSAYVIGLIAHSALAGVVAAFLVPFAPALFKDISVPFSDPTMTAWSIAALAAAVLAYRLQYSSLWRGKAFWAASIAAGALLFLAFKSKETGLAVVPAVAILMWNTRQNWRVLSALLVGLLVGWLILATLDWIFLGKFWASLRVEDQSVPRLMTNAKPEREVGRLKGLSHTLWRDEHLGLVLLGLSGGLAGVKKNLHFKVILVWLFSCLAFLCAVAWFYTGIAIQERYLVASDISLCLLIGFGFAYWWTRADDSESNLGAAILAAGSVLLTAFVLGGYKLIGDTRSGMLRTEEYILPLALIVLPFIPWLTGRRWARRVAVVSSLVLVASVSWVTSTEYIAEARQEMEPWDTAIRYIRERRAHQKDLTVYVWGSRSLRKADRKPFHHNKRIARRLDARARADMPPIETARGSSSIERKGKVQKVPKEDILFLIAEKDRERFEKIGWKLLSRGKESGTRFAFMVHPDADEAHEGDDDR